MTVASAPVLGRLSPEGDCGSPGARQRGSLQVRV